MIKKISFLILFFSFLSIGIMMILNVKPIRGWFADKVFYFKYGIDRHSQIMVEMRDGVRLRTEVYKPAKSEGKYPVVLMRTTYSGTGLKWPLFFANNNFVVVVQYVRGRFGSEGVYSPHRYSRDDGFDTISWIVKQKWSNGNVGTFGCSYLGETQSILAAAKHPNHIAMITDGGGGAIGNALGSYGYFGVFENGVLNLASALGWFTRHGALNQSEAVLLSDYKEKLNTSINQLPIKNLGQKVVPYPTGFDELVSHPLTDNWWKEQGYVTKGDTFTTAGLHVNTWFDQTVQDTFRLAEYMKNNAANPRAKHQYLIIGPGTHCSSAMLPQGPLEIGDLNIEYKDLDYETIYLNWFNYWLKHEPSSLPEPYTYYRLHSSKWESSKHWPPSEIKSTTLFLSSYKDSKKTRRGALSVLPQKNTSDLDYIYDPGNPVMSLGGTICCTEREDELSGPRDQTPLEKRDDILVFETKKLTKDTEIAGNVKATLYITSSARDTDFMIKLIDKSPDGVALGLHDGVVRLRYRNGIDKPNLAEPGEIYKVEIELRPIAYRFKEGHRIVLHVTSSNFPRLARNLNTGGDEYQGTEFVTARNTIMLGEEFPSTVDLPIIE